jgi:hypothetical protein
MFKRQTFVLNKGSYSYIAVATTEHLDNDKKLTVRYYWILDSTDKGNAIRELEECCAETIALEKKVRTWASKNGYIMWSY